jgi:hypothetical protein
VSSGCIATKEDAMYLFDIKLAHGQVAAAGAMLFSVWLTSLRAVIAQDPQATGAATTVQQPVFGVAVSPEGVMKQLQFAPPGGELFRQRAAMARATLNADIQKPSPLRKVSLARLQAAIDGHQEKQLPDDILKLAGLQRIEYIFAVPGETDIVIAGPAQGWIDDADGRAVGMFNRRPVILLEDLLTALRTFRADRPTSIWAGCSIGPTAAGMARFKEFQRSIPKQVSKGQEQSVAQAVWQGVEQALGDGDITVFYTAHEN